MERTSITLNQDQWKGLWNFLNHYDKYMLGDAAFIIPIAEEIRKNIKIVEEPKKEDKENTFHA